MFKSIKTLFVCAGLLATLVAASPVLAAKPKAETAAPAPVAAPVAASEAVAPAPAPAGH